MAYPDNLDYSRDATTWVEVETVTYLSKTTEAIPTSGTQVEGTVWIGIDRDMIEADAELSKFDVAVELRGEKLGAIIPKKDDLMTRTNGTRWIIGRIEGPEIVDWRAYCNQDFSYAQGIDK